MDDKIKYLKSISNIPLRYRDAKFEAISKEQERLVSILREVVATRSDFVLYGGVGVGKTHITIGALNALIEKGVHCKYITEFQLLELYARKEYKEFDKFKTSTVLLVDEVGKRELAPWQQVQLEELISERYNQMLPTLFITNLNAESFKKVIGDRITDRLRDNNVKQFTMKGDSLRGKIRDFEPKPITSITKTPQNQNLTPLRQDTAIKTDTKESQLQLRKINDKVKELADEKRVVKNPT